MVTGAVNERAEEYEEMTDTWPQCDRDRRGEQKKWFDTTESNFSSHHATCMELRGSVAKVRWGKRED